MTDRAWTDGPWLISGPSSGMRRGDDGGDYAIYVERENAKHIIAEAFSVTGDENTREPALDNAHLIAAAKDLYEALKMARECIAWCRKHHPDPQSGSGLPVEVILDAALDKARGQS